MDMTRRELLQASAAIGGLGLITGFNAHASGPHAAASENAMGMLTDLSLCVGCRRCEWACNEANGLPNVPLDELDAQDVYGEVRRTSATAFTVVNRFESADDGLATYVKRQCMHCVEPACVSVCPVKAFTKTPEGPVIYDESLCMGCRYCMVACPFDVPAYEYDNATSPRVQKCTMCFERIKDGGAAPACASICPQEAIAFGKRSDLLEMARDRIRNNPDTYVDHIFGENEVGGTNWLFLSSVPFEELGFQTDVGTDPMPERTEGYLSLVPQVHAIWPMILMGLYAFTNTKDAASGHVAD